MYEVVVVTTATAVDNDKSTSTTEANYGQIYNLYSALCTTSMGL